VLRSRSCLLVVAVVALAGCWPGARAQKNRELHYVDDVLVASEAPAPAAYAAYLRARIALDRNPPQLDEARGHILDALRWQPDEPQLWTVKAEIEWKAGDFAAAERDLALALELRPGYPEAQRLLAQVRSAGNLSSRPGGRAGKLWSRAS
jgi:predicted Zn-dependent protease